MASPPNARGVQAPLMHAYLEADETKCITDSSFHDILIYLITILHDISII